MARLSIVQRLVGVRMLDNFDLGVWSSRSAMLNSYSALTTYVTWSGSVLVGIQTLDIWTQPFVVLLENLFADPEEIEGCIIRREKRQKHFPIRPTSYMNMQHDIDSSP